MIGRPLTSPHRHPPDVVAQALELGDSGWTPPQISRILAGRGLSVSASSIRRWLDPRVLEAGRAANRERARRLREEERRNRPPNPYAGLTGLALKVAKLEDRIAAVERQIERNGGSA